MYDHDDIGRSVRRYVAEMVGEPWQLDLERKEVVDDARPAGVVEVGDVRPRRGRAGSLQQGNVEEFAPVTVSLYPELLEPRQAGRAARLLASDLYDLIRFGTADGAVFLGGRPASGPERIPLYDYALVQLVGTAEERRGPANPHDVLWAEDYSCRPIQDPLDPQRWSVILEMRVSWERPGRIPSSVAEPIAQSVPGSVG